MSVNQKLEVMKEVEKRNAERIKAMKKTLRDRALGTILHSRFIAREDDLNRPLTDDEVRAEAQYQLEDLPYKGLEPDECRKAMRQMKALLK